MLPHFGHRNVHDLASLAGSCDLGLGWLEKPANADGAAMMSREACLVSVFSAVFGYG